MIKHLIKLKIVLVDFLMQHVVQKFQLYSKTLSI